MATITKGALESENTVLKFTVNDELLIVTAVVGFDTWMSKPPDVVTTACADDVPVSPTSGVLDKLNTVLRLTGIVPPEVATSTRGLLLRVNVPLDTLTVGAELSVKVPEDTFTVGALDRLTAVVGLVTVTAVLGLLTDMSRPPELDTGANAELVTGSPTMMIWRCVLDVRMSESRNCPLDPTAGGTWIVT